MAAVISTYEEFVEVHGVLLAASGLPQSLHRRLFSKLSSETFDAGEFFQVEPLDGGRQRRLVATAEEMKEASDVFLVDHAWTFRLSDARKQLEELPGLVERMGSLMCVDIDISTDGNEVDYSAEGLDDNVAKSNPADTIELEIRMAKEKGDDSVKWLELEEMDINDDMLLSLDLPGKFPDLVALSLCGNKLESTEIVTQEISKLKHLKALWINDNPVLQKYGDRLAYSISQQCPRLEIFNRWFTCNFDGWALGFCGEIYDKDNPGCPNPMEHPLCKVTSLDLSDRSVHNLINKAFSAAKLPNLSYLNLRGNPLDQHSTDVLMELLQSFTYLTALEVDIPGPLGDSAAEIVKSLPNLSSLNGIDKSKVLEFGNRVIASILQPCLPEWDTDEPLIDRVINAMWLYLMTYRLADEEKIDETSVWYVMDELGSALRHSDDPNFRVSPFLYMPDGTLASAISYSIIWPIQNVEKSEECTRDFLPSIGEDKQRSARLTAWFHTPVNFYIEQYQEYRQNMRTAPLIPQPPKHPTTTSLLCSDGKVLRVYTDLPQVEEFLSRPEFAITSEPKDADIIWTSMQIDDEIKAAVGLTDQQYINQFPNEACLVMKHNLAETIHKAYGLVDWVQPTYNLETQLPHLIGDYLVREKNGLDNLWILKPWNMARTIDTTITSNSSAIIRLMETGPKICQKYIEHPALFNGRKFDLRYIVLVRSMDPLEIFIADIFWVRLANNQYSLQKHSLFEYETHFTVMNYRGTLNHMNTPEFVREFEQEHQVKWSDIHLRVKKLLRSVFESAATVHPEMQSTMSRAMYGVDVMLDSQYQPKLLEVTYCPDCTRACKYDMEAVVSGGHIVKGREFYNYVYGCLFLNETTHVSAL